MATEVTDAFKAAWSYGPSSNPDQPDKGVIHGVGQVIDNKFAAVNESIEGIASVASSGAKWVPPVALATTGNVTLSGEQTIDGTLTSSSRVLVKSQSTPSQNGVYTTGAGAWTRATDADTAAEMLGLAVSVNGGTVNGGKSFICQAIAPITIGTTALPFVEMLNQSFVTSAVNALGEDINSVDGKVDGLLAPISGAQTIGVTSPVVGTGGSATTYVLAKEVEFDGVASLIRIYGTGSTIEVGAFSRSSSDVFTRVNYVTVQTVTGANEIPIKLPVGEGQYLGITTAAGGNVHYNTETNHGYFNGTLTGSSFTDATVNSGIKLELGFVIEQVDNPQEMSLFSDDKMILQKLFKTDAPTAGAGNVSAGTLIAGKPALSDGIIDTVELWPDVDEPATIRIDLWERVGLTFTRVQSLRRVTTSPGVLNTIRINKKIKKGQYVGIQSAGNWTTTTAATGEGYYYGATTSADSFTSAALSTVAIIQIRVNLRRTSYRHEVSLYGVDRVLLIGPSYQAGAYNPLAKNAISKASLHTDRNCENFSYSGHTAGMLLRDRLRVDYVTGYYPLLPRQMGTTYALITEGWNSAYHPTNAVSFTQYQEDLRQIIETVKAMGAVPVLCSEWQPVYDASAHAVYKALAEETGAMFLDMIPHTLRMINGTPYDGFWQGVSGANPVRHPGVRSNSVISDQLDRFMKALGRPANSMKLFRKRGTITVTDIDDDLMFRNDYERAERWKEILLNQQSLTAATEKYYDELTSGSGSYDQNLVTKSEYLTLQDGGSVPFGDYALLDVVIDATQNHVDRFQLTISDPAVQVYVKDAFQSPYGASGKSVCLWTEIAGSSGVFAIDHVDLPGKMHFDKLTFLLYKSGGVTITEPKIEWWGEAGKPAYPIPVRPAATGSELLNITKFATISGNKATGWDDVGGTITPSNDATYQLPYDITHFVNVDATKKVVQTLNYAVDNFDDVEVEIRVTARYFPAVFASSGSYPSGAPINQDSFDWRKVVVDLIDPTGTFTFTQSAKVGLWWDEVVFRAILPMRVNPLDIRVSGSAEIQLAKVSVKRV